MSHAQKILIVDDDHRLVDSLAVLLNNEGYETAKAFTGNEAIECLGRDNFDLVLLDIVMPDMSGLTIMDNMNREYPETLVIVMMTGHASTESAIKAVRTGAFDYLRKPFEYEALLRRVESALERKKLAHEKHVLDTYVRKLISPQVFEALNRGEDLSPRNEDVVVGFSDIRGFTKLTNTIEMFQLNTVLEYFFELCAETIDQANGILDKFIGDAVMWFHKGQSLRESVEQCIRVGTTLVRSLKALDKRLHRRLHIKLRTQVGIGIACGTCAVGIFGSQRHRLQYSVMGPAVNLASRLCSEARPNEILLGGEVIEYCPYRTTKIGFRPLKGFDHEVEIRKVSIPK